MWIFNVLLLQSILIIGYCRYDSNLDALLLRINEGLDDKDFNAIKKEFATEKVFIRSCGIDYNVQQYINELLNEKHASFMLTESTYGSGYTVGTYRLVKGPESMVSGKVLIENGKITRVVQKCPRNMADIFG